MQKELKSRVTNQVWRRNEEVKDKEAKEREKEKEEGWDSASMSVGYSRH